MRAQVRNQLRLAKRICKVQIGRRRIYRIGIQNHQPIHFARIQVRHQRFEIANLIAWYRIHRLRRYRHRLAHIAQRVINCQRQLRNRLVLVEPCNHRALAGVRLQVLRQRSKKLLLRIGPRIRRRIHARHAHSLRQLRRKRRNLARPQPQPMLGLQARCGRRTLYRIQPVQMVWVLAPLCVLADQLVKSGEAGARQKVRVQRHDHIRIVQRVLNIQTL